MAAILFWIWGGADLGRAMLAPARPSLSETPPGPDRAADIEKVQSFLHQKIVRQRLKDFGLAEEEIAMRLNRLSNEELRQVAMKIDREHPAGDALGVIVTALVVGILVLLFIFLAKRV